jgi:hypothetical protein
MDSVNKAESYNVFYSLATLADGSWAEAGAGGGDLLGGGLSDLAENGL